MELIDQDNLNIAKTENEEIYKEWLRTKDVSRFLSIKYFEKGEKFIIDIGQSDTSSNALKSSTSVYVNAFSFLAYIKAITAGTAPVIYPASDDPKKNLHTPESIAYFGGSMVDGKPIARVFKSHYWANFSNGTTTYDSSAFVWKTAHFDGKQTATGAFIQTGSQPLSADSIKVTRKMIAEAELILTKRLMR